ncbi:MAG: XRE family transcriptional regulator [Bacteroidetes bacterium]|nr:XRE family transcriptional regulator [Bacteroidota bacterium]
MSAINQNLDFAERLASARRMAGLSLQQLADNMDNSISKQALHQFEQGKSRPEAGTLQNIANALKVSLDYFFRPKTLTFEKLAYRKKVKLTKTEEAAIQETAKDKLERYFEVESLTDTVLRFQNPIAGTYITNQEDIEKAAESLRHNWELGVKPIPSVIEMLEEKGLKVIEIDASDAFQGFSAEANEELVIVLNKNDDACRKRFTAVHELAHIVLQIDENLDEEKTCHSFAGAFLFPRQSVIEVFSEKRKKVAFAELKQQKEYYGLSIQAILMRLRNLEIINDATYKGFMIWMTKMGYRTKEPGQYAGVEKAIRFSGLVYRAAIEEVVSLSKAASLAGQSLGDFRRTLTGNH